MNHENNLCTALRVSALAATLAAIACLPLSAFTDLGNNVLLSDGSATDTQAAIDAAADGYEVRLPAGNFSWSTPITIFGKGIKLRGAGSGRVLARSSTSLTCGAGAKTFIVNASGITGITNGASLRIERLGTSVVGGNATGTRTWMEGTVTNYSGTTLDMNITSSANPVTQSVWIIISPAATTITNNAGSSNLITIGEDVTNSNELADLRIIQGSGTSNQIIIFSASGGQPTLIHDCYFETGLTGNVIRAETNKGIVWNCSFVAFPFSRAPLGIELKNPNITSDWTTVSTMGALDTTGKNNFYVEDCDFHAWLNCSDSDDNSRSVFRYNLLNNSGHGSHGADTSFIGARHYEFYNETFIFNGFGDGQTFNLNWFFYLRGGTGVITDCVIPNMISSDYGDKGEVVITVQNLQRNSGPNPLWGNNIPGAQYPCPRQVGMGYVTGLAGNDSMTYIGDSEPLYQWNNTGGGNLSSPELANYSPPTGNQDTVTDYVIVGRDYLNAVKPGYAKYIYPHPLRTDLVPTAPSNARVSITVQ